MDHIQITQLRLEMTIGTLEWERAITQPIFLDIAFGIDAQSIAQSDDIDKAVSYADVQKALEAWSKDNQPKLIETAADKISSFLIDTFSLPWVRLTLHKKQALSKTQGVSITVERKNG